ncbi:MAG: DUF3576 domain-containing protein [Caulobacterales bacterium]
MRGSLIRVLIASTAALALVGCGSSKENKTGFRTGDIESGGIGFFGGKKNKKGSDSEIGVNSFLWRATLDTVNFMPLASADPFGGVIITDWYSSPQTPTERFKLTVYILDTRLRADGLKVNVFRQVNTNGAWTDSASDPQTGIDIEDAILTRARQLRIATLKG